MVSGKHDELELPRSSCASQLSRERIIQSGDLCGRSGLHAKSKARLDTAANRSQRRCPDPAPGKRRWLRDSICASEVTRRKACSRAGQAAGEKREVASQNDMWGKTVRFDRLFLIGEVSDERFQRGFALRLRALIKRSQDLSRLDKRHKFRKKIG